MLYRTPISRKVYVLAIFRELDTDYLMFYDLVGIRAGIR